MNTYKVVIEYEVDANSAKEAAEETWASLTDPTVGGTPLMEVTNRSTGEVDEIDLDVDYGDEGED